MLRKIGEVVLSALPARLRLDDTQAYICMHGERGNPVSALGVGGNGPWKKKVWILLRPCHRDILFTALRTQGTLWQYERHFCTQHSN